MAIPTVRASWPVKRATSKVARRMRERVDALIGGLGGYLAAFAE